MMTASTIAPMAMAMPPSDMMFELMPWPNMMKCNQHRDGQDDDGHHRAAQVQQKGDAYQRDHQAFLSSFSSVVTAR